MLNLNIDEQAWMDEFRRQLYIQFPGQVEDILIYGPYARGVSDPEVDMKVLVIFCGGNSKQKEAVGYLGPNREQKEAILRLSSNVDMALGFVTSPTVRAISEEEWARAKETGSTFYMSAIESGISVK